MSLSQQDALELAKRLARDDAFRAQVAADPVGTLGEHGITISPEKASRFAPMLPPKHVFEEALVNVREASEFASDGVESVEAYAYWLFVVFVAT